MAEQTIGTIYAQSGASVRGSADYQRTYDSRARFMEREFETDFSVTLPAAAAPTSYYEKTTVIRHGLGKVPMFETDRTDVDIFADSDRIFIRRLISSSLSSSVTIAGTLRVYNVSPFDDYVAPKSVPQGSSSPRSDYGVKFLDGHTPGVDIGDNSPIGFSIDTTKKILAIHRAGIAKIRDYIGLQSEAASVNTTTDVITIQPLSTGFGRSLDITWLQKLGQAVIVTGTPSSPLVSGTTTYYVIPLTATTIKLAASYDNALNGIGINLTTAGTTPWGIQATADPANTEDNVLYHGVGYPPTFQFAEINRDEWSAGYPGDDQVYIGPMLDRLSFMMTADNNNLHFFGIQQPYSGWVGYIILKDPAEIAG